MLTGYGKHGFLGDYLQLFTPRFLLPFRLVLFLRGEWREIGSTGIFFKSCDAS